MKSHMLLFSIEECKLWSFWVVTWLVYNNFEFGAKNGPELPEMTKNGLILSKMARNDDNIQKD